VTVATSEFIALARDTALSQGVADACFVVVPHPLGMIPPEEVLAKADEAWPQIRKAATEWSPTGTLPPPRPAYPAERLTFEGSVEDLNRFFSEKGWSLGLPVLPPTSERVKAMLQGTRREASEELGKVPPRMGTLTVELIAVHAAMAGCKPEYMPVLIAAIEALLDPKANWRGATTTTGTAGALVIVNGPIVDEIGIACGQGAAGADHQANASMGYAINLMADIVGGSRTPSPDKSTLGAPSDFVCWFFGENEKALPDGWAPFHTERGFAETDSVVTVMGIYPPGDNIDHWSTNPDEHITWWAHLVSPLTSIGGPCWVTQMEQPHIVGMGPEHAQLIATGGWDKDAFRKAFWEKVRIPLSVWPKGCPNMNLLKEKYGPVKKDTAIPVTFRPQDILVVMAGFPDVFR
jgi:hypothetical protein